MTTASLLIELHTEELPPKALKTLSEAFAAGIEKGLRSREFLTADSRVTAFGAPRRLAVHISAVKARSDDQPFRQKLMPLAVAQDKAKQWTAAFLKKLEGMGRAHMAGVPVGTNEGPDCLAIESDGKADAVFLNGVTKGSALSVSLQPVLDDALAALPIPKVMSYQLADGRTTVQFVRPAHRLVALHGHAVVPVSALGLHAGTKTFGHRFHTQGEIAIHSADTYEKQLLEQGKVIASFEARHRRVAELVTDAAKQLGAHAVMPADLLDEVTALVEWPVVYESGFEKEFLDVPQECLILTMQQNQKYFALKDDAGRLLNRFLLVSHIDANNPEFIIGGNARVVRARLADAKFFYDQDRKTTLESRISGLASVVYHNKLGSQLERVERLTGIAVEIGKSVGVDATHVERAARLAKADLRTLMVGEFPELQGIMGTYYARHDNEPADVANAIEEHYRPRFAGDALPTTKVGTCVALADKLETLVGLFGVGERPTGDRDPFALRRHALGVLRMLIEDRLALPLDRLLAIGVAAFGNVKAFADPRADLEAFLFDRLRGLLRDDGYSANEIEAVVAMKPQRIDDVTPRLVAVRAFAALPEAESLAAANKRIGNILKKAEGTPGAVDPALLFEPAEKELAAAFARIKPVTDSQFAAGDYTAMLTSLAPLKLPVDAFFDDVMVNVDDPKIRANRLALLAALRAQMNRVADLSLLAAG
ncbi:MAG: glycine--tRNA ligase subunit beta [Burkholderiaceae bacterium]|nr:glycine--tRNA ligase subunit beta [Burkholderiaceae bacterium]